MLEIWIKVRPKLDQKNEDEIGETANVNVCQLRIKHEIEKQKLIVNLQLEKQRNKDLIDSNCGYVSDLANKISKLKNAAEETEDQKKLLMEAQLELKSKENTINNLQRMIKNIKGGEEGSEEIHESA